MGASTHIASGGRLRRLAIIATLTAATAAFIIDPRPSAGLSAQEEAGFRSIFDGRSFDGWEADRSVWRIEDGSFVGEVTPERQISTNSFLIWRGGRPADFEFRAEYRISRQGNSGVNYRSEEVPGIPFAVKGYQADIDGENRYTGQNYEERGRGFLAMRGQVAVLEPGKKPGITGSLGDPEGLKGSIRAEGWNEIRIVARGNRLRHYVNGVAMSETVDNDSTHRKASGLLCLQVHTGPRMRVEYRRLRLKEW